MKEYIFKEGDTVEGILKGLSKIQPIEYAKELFYTLNGGKKIFKIGDKVLVPIEEDSLQNK